MAQYGHFWDLNGLLLLLIGGQKSFLTYTYINKQVSIDSVFYLIQQILGSFEPFLVLGGKISGSGGGSKLFRGLIYRLITFIM